jgi:tetratricopeptide (TPR) repeat protein
MMPAMRCLPPLLLAAFAAACAGVTPRPEDARAEALPTRAMSPAEVVQLAGLVDEAVQVVVLRRYDEAERLARAALELDPRCARARSVLGMVMLQRAKLVDPPDLFLANGGEAETLLAEQLAPADAFVGWMRAVFLVEAGHMSAGAAAAEAALARTAGAPLNERAALFGVAGTYRYELGEERAALPLLQAYVGIRPEDAAAHFRIGSCLLRIAAVPYGPREKAVAVAQDHAERAARAFARSFELAPGDEDAGLAVGAALLRAAELAGQRGDAAARDQRWRDAEVQFDQVAGLFLGSAEPLFRLGVVAEARGDVAAAEAAYGKALDREAAHLGSLLNLAALLDDGKAPDRVADLLRRALQADTASPGLTKDERRRIEERLLAPSVPPTVKRP